MHGVVIAAEKSPMKMMSIKEPAKGIKIVSSWTNIAEVKMAVIFLKTP